MPFIANLYPQTWTFRDAKGRTTTVRGFIFGGGSSTLADVATQAEAIRTALATPGTTGTKLTNAAIQGGRGPDALVATTQYGVSGTAIGYTDVRQKAIFVFEDANGRFHRSSIPAPVIGIFLADHVTIDPSNALVAAFTAAIMGNTNGAYWSDQYGNKMTGFPGGFFLDRKSRRKSVLVRTPQLTASLPGEE